MFVSDQMMQGSLRCDDVFASEDIKFRKRINREKKG